MVYHGFQLYKRGMPLDITKYETVKQYPSSIIHDIKLAYTPALVFVSINGYILCTWMLKVSSGVTVNLFFVTKYPETGTNCIYPVTALITCIMKYTCLSYVPTS